MAHVIVFAAASSAFLKIIDFGVSMVVLHCVTIYGYTLTSFHKCVSYDYVVFWVR